MDGWGGRVVVTDFGNGRRLDFFFSFLRCYAKDVAWLSLFFLGCFCLLAAGKTSRHASCPFRWRTHLSVSVVLSLSLSLSSHTSAVSLASLLPEDQFSE